jgi:predicted secreted hydrolase
LSIAALIMLIGFAITRLIAPSTVPGAPMTAVPEAVDKGSRLSVLLGSESVAGYAVADQARIFRFPEDHGPHQNFRNEWWYLTGNLDGAHGQRFGYELTFFRFSLTPGLQANTSGNTESNWRTNQVYMAHFTVTDEKNEQFHVEQRFSRGALGLAGAQIGPFKVWIEDWSIQQAPDGGAAAAAGENWQLTASGPEIALDLNLVATRGPVLNGIDGLSQKSDAAGNASYYYSIPRMRSTGTLRIAGEAHAVSGVSWLDREWSSSALAADQQGWDWFALQLSDGSDLMFYNIRKTDGSQDEYSAGTWIASDGESRHLRRQDVVITVIDQWQSPAGGTYPSRWEIHLPALDLTLTVTPVIAAQELITTVRYWEGAVDVSGRRKQQAIEGRGYVELTGYSR